MGSRLIMGCLILVVILSKGGEAVTVHEVGGSLGWEVPPNTTFYTDWATDKTFVVGDSLRFNWSGSHDVAEATKTQYDNCEKPTTVKFSSSPGVVPLTTAGSHYFLCTIGTHCTSGQKLAITVAASNSTTPSISSPPPPPPSSVSTHVSVNALFATTSALFVYFMA